MKRRIKKHSTHKHTNTHAPNIRFMIILLFLRFGVLKSQFEFNVVYFFFIFHVLFSIILEWIERRQYIFVQKRWRAVAHATERAFLSCLTICRTWKIYKYNRCELNGMLFWKRRRRKNDARIERRNGNLLYLRQ